MLLPSPYWQLDTIRSRCAAGKTLPAAVCGGRRFIPSLPIPAKPGPISRRPARSPRYSGARSATSPSRHITVPRGLRESERSTTHPRRACQRHTSAIQAPARSHPAARNNAHGTVGAVLPRFRFQGDPVSWFNARKVTCRVSCAGLPAPVPVASALPGAGHSGNRSHGSLR